MNKSPADRVILRGDIASVLGRARVMVTAGQSGATHERIGPVEAVSATGGMVGLRGAAHDAAIDLSVIRSLVADRSGRMGDRAMPRIDALGSDNAVLFSLIALDGLEPFDVALAGIEAGEEAPAQPPRKTDAAAEVAEADVAKRALDQAVADGAEITIESRRPGLLQSWRGRVGSVRVAIGFVNVIEPSPRPSRCRRALAPARRRRDGRAACRGRQRRGDRHRVGWAVGHLEPAGVRREWKFNMSAQDKVRAGAVPPAKASPLCNA